MASPGSDSFGQKIIDKFNQSRFFTISLVFHIVLVAIFGTTVLFKAISEPPDFEGAPGGFVDSAEAMTAPPTQVTQPKETTFTVTAPSSAAVTTSTPAITEGPSTPPFPPTPLSARRKSAAMTSARMTIDSASARYR